MTTSHEPGVPFPLSADGASSGPGFFPLPGLPAGFTDIPGSGSYSAHRVGGTIFIKAEGTLPSWNQIPDIRPSPLRIYPQQFDFLFRTPTVVLPATRPFSIVEGFGFPPDAKVVVIHDIDGPHAIAISEVTDADGRRPHFLASRADEPVDTVKLGTGNSLQEAFDNARAHLPQFGSLPDGFQTYTILESGYFQGGFAGFHNYYAKVEYKEGFAHP